MANCDFFQLSEQRESRAGNERANGERDYVRHIRNHMLTAGERLLLFLAIAILTGIALGGRMSAPVHSAHAVPAATQASDTWRPDGMHYHVRCEEESPYSGRSC